MRDAGTSPAAAALLVVLVGLAGTGALVYLASSPGPSGASTAQRGPVVDVRAWGAGWLVAEHVQGPDLVQGRLGVVVDSTEGPPRQVPICQRPEPGCPPSPRALFRVGDRLFAPCEHDGPVQVVLTDGDAVLAVDRLVCTEA